MIKMDYNIFGLINRIDIITADIEILESNLKQIEKYQNHVEATMEEWKKVDESFKRLECKAKDLVREISKQWEN